MHRDTFRDRFPAGDLQYRSLQRNRMMRPRASRQRAVNIEKNE